MIKFFAGLVVLPLFLLEIVSPGNIIFAKPSVSPEPIPSPEAQVAEELNSFKMFWPLVAGKTLDDGFVYSLKRLKENLRGMIIFGKVEKADYLVFLATKRILEAEKLLNEGKYELANETLGDALNHLSGAEGKIQEYTENERLHNKNREMIDRLSNIEKLTGLLASNKTASSDKLKEVVDKVSSITKKLQG